MATSTKQTGNAAPIFSEQEQLTVLLIGCRHAAAIITTPAIQEAVESGTLRHRPRASLAEGRPRSDVLLRYLTASSANASCYTNASRYILLSVAWSFLSPSPHPLHAACFFRPSAAWRSPSSFPAGVHAAFLLSLPAAFVRLPDGSSSSPVRLPNLRVCLARLRSDLA